MKKRDYAQDVINAASVVRETAAAAREARLRGEKQALLHELRLAEERLGVVAELEENRRPLRPLLSKPPKSKGRISRRTATAVAAASDWHIEEHVDPKTIGGLNEYTPDIAKRRAARFFEGIEWLVREQQSMFQIQDLFLWGGGDIINGYIHEEFLEGNFMSPTEAVLFGQDLFSDGIRFLLGNTELNINVGWDFGNHGRTTQKPRVATAAKNSFEWLLGHMLKKEFRDHSRVQFQIADGHHSIYPIGDYILHATHGDKVKSNGGVGGIDVPLNRAVMQWHQTMPAHNTMHGHFHTYQSGQRRTGNGSLIGYNAFARDIVRAAYEPPQQAFFIVDQKRGKTQCAPIWVEEKR